MKVSYRVVGEQHHRPPIWAVVGFCVSWGQEPAGKRVFQEILNLDLPPVACLQAFLPEC